MTDKTTSQEPGDQKDVLAAVDSGLDQAGLGSDAPTADEAQVLQPTPAAAEAAAAAAAEATKAGETPPAGPEPELRATGQTEQQRAAAAAAAAAAGKPAPGAPAPAAPQPGAPQPGAPQPGAQPGRHKLLEGEDLETPEGLSERAGERFTKLTAGYRELAAENQSIRSHVAEHVVPQLERLQRIDQTMEQVAAQPEQINGMVQYIAGVNSGDETQLRQSRAILVQELEAIDAALGETGPGSPDLVQRSPELAAAVASGHITEEWAQKLALLQARQGQTEHQLQRAGQEVQARDYHAQTEHVYAQAQADVNRLDSYLQETDPDFLRIRPVLEQSAANMARQGIDPRQWVPLLTDQYRAMKAVSGAGAAIQPSPHNGLGNGLTPGLPAPVDTRGQAPGPGAELARPGASAATPANAAAQVQNARSALEASDIALRNAGLL